MFRGVLLTHAEVVTWRFCTKDETPLLAVKGFLSRMKRSSISSVRCRRSMHTVTHIMGSRSSSSSDKLVRKAGDKRGRAHCPGIRDEQRFANVTTNSPWSPNITFPLYSTHIPSSYSVLVLSLSYLPLLFLFVGTYLTIHGSFRLCPCLLSSHPLHLLKRAARERVRE